MAQVAVSSKTRFVMDMMDRGWHGPDDIPENVAIISIGTPYYSGHRLRSGSRVLNIDIMDGDNISNGDIDKIYCFIKNHFGSDFHIHCDAGISRSQAVAQYLLEMFPETYELAPGYVLTKTPNARLFSGLKHKLYSDQHTITY